jgi:hypothetical protein
MKHSANPFTLEDVEKIRRMMIEGRKIEVSSEAGKRILREAQFSVEQINEAYAKALRNLGMY